MDYIEATEALRLKCKEETKKKLPSLGVKLPKCINEINTLLPLLEAIACCYEWCPGKDKPHIIQRIVGKGISQTLAGLELAFSGHYDEAMGLARSVGESTNLTWLFSLDPITFQEWLSSDGRKRWNSFRPSEVRRKITALNSPVPIDTDRYSLLSAETVHVQPSAKPQDFNVSIPTLGGFYQEAGFIAAVNELAAPIAILGTAAIRLLPELPNSGRKEIYKTTLQLLDSIGGVDLQKIVELRNENNA